MHKASEILRIGPPAPSTCQCVHCGADFKTVIEDYCGFKTQKTYYCPKCVAIREQAGHEAEFRRCERCKVSYLLPERDGWGYNYCEPCRPLAQREQQDERRKERIAEWPKICPPLYLESDPARLPKLSAVLAWKYGGRGLLLHGETGKGKTRCAWQLLRRLHVEEGIRPVVFTATSYSVAITKNFNAEGNPEKWLERINGAQLVFFDDFGKCRLTERGESELFGIIEERMANQLPIIITTNFVGGSLAGNLRSDIGSAMVRRLRECCECIGF